MWQQQAVFRVIILAFPVHLDRFSKIYDASYSLFTEYFKRLFISLLNLYKFLLFIFWQTILNSYFKKVYIATGGH